MKQVRDSVSEDRVDAIASFGFTDRQARFLATVMVYAGAFLERQYCTFAGVAHGQRTHDFVRKLIDRGYVTVITPGALHRGRLFHLQYKPLYEAIGEAGRILDPRTHLIVLLGGEAGLLRCGEMMALEWSDVDLVNRQVCIRRSEWNGHVTTPKGGRLRHVPLTRRLAAALSEHRHLRSARVLCQDGAAPMTRQIVQTRAKRAARKGGLTNGGVHILRHTFCSHLAMRGVPARAIQELAGHKDLSMTQRYMHLSPAALDAAIRLLEQPNGPAQRGGSLQSFGDVVETGTDLGRKVNV